ncbi:hypothetical protein [Roseivirga seohaensis]|uniref:hypothetical protein n=1 Tax=Roseivirga seohaensis TaxID=1914963 RepID=UPI003BAAD8B3
MSNLNIPFKTEEFCIEQNKPIPQSVATKLWIFHIIPMLVVRTLLDSPIWASQNSGFRPKAYEISKGRSGESQHTFEGESKGAIDWTCKKSLLPKLLELILEHTNYTRIAVYENFIHCDHKATDGNRYLFTSNEKSVWTLTKTIKI